MKTFLKLKKFFLLSIVFCHLLNAESDPPPPPAPPPPPIFTDEPGGPPPPPRPMPVGQKSDITWFEKFLKGLDENNISSKLRAVLANEKDHEIFIRCLQKTFLLNLIKTCSREKFASLDILINSLVGSFPLEREVIDKMVQRGASIEALDIISKIGAPDDKDKAVIVEYFKNVSRERLIVLKDVIKDPEMARKVSEFLKSNSVPSKELEAHVDKVLNELKLKQIKALLNKVMSAEEMSDQDRQILVDYLNEKKPLPFDRRTLFSALYKITVFLQKWLVSDSESQKYHLNIIEEKIAEELGSESFWEKLVEGVSDNLAKYLKSVTVDKCEKLFSEISEEDLPQGLNFFTRIIAFMESKKLNETNKDLFEFINGRKKMLEDVSKAFEEGKVWKFFVAPGKKIGMVDEGALASLKENLQACEMSSAPVIAKGSSSTVMRLRTMLAEDENIYKQFYLIGGKYFKRNSLELLLKTISKETFTVNKVLPIDVKNKILAKIKNMATSSSSDSIKDIDAFCELFNIQEKKQEIDFSSELSSKAKILLAAWTEAVNTTKYLFTEGRSDNLHAFALVLNLAEFLDKKNKKQLNMALQKISEDSTNFFDNFRADLQAKLTDLATNKVFLNKIDLDAFLNIIQNLTSLISQSTPAQTKDNLEKILNVWLSFWPKGTFGGKVLSLRHISLLFKHEIMKKIAVAVQKINLKQKLEEELSENQKAILNFLDTVYKNTTKVTDIKVAWADINSVAIPDNEAFAQIDFGVALLFLDQQAKKNSITELSSDSKRKLQEIFKKYFKTKYNYLKLMLFSRPGQSKEDLSRALRQVSEGKAFGGDELENELYELQKGINVFCNSLDKVVKWLEGLTTRLQ